MFKREAVEENYKKINSNTKPSDIEKESLKNAINRLTKELQLELYAQWFVKFKGKWAQTKTSILLNLDTLNSKEFYELMNTLIFILEENTQRKIIKEQLERKNQEDMLFYNKFKAESSENSNEILGNIPVPAPSNSNCFDYSVIRDNVVSKQQMYKDQPLMENENYLSMFGIERKDIMKSIDSFKNKPH